MRAADLREGLRVRLAHTLDLYPHGMIPKGRIGVVDRVDPEAATLPHDRVIAEIRLSSAVPALAPWDNCVLIHGTNHHPREVHGPTVEEYFEMGIPVPWGR
jgi:hypothetical protein